jgi:hypothetical protein
MTLREEKGKKLPFFQNFYGLVWKFGSDPTVLLSALMETFP